MSLFVRYTPVVLGGSGGGGGGGGSGVTTVGTIDTQIPSTDGAIIVGTAIYMQSASTGDPGLVNNSSQSFSGDKVFTGRISALATDTNSQIGINGTLTLSGTTQQGFDSQITSTSAATNRVRAYRANITTAASTAVASVEGYTTSGLTIGTSGSVTNYTDFIGNVARAHIATNNATLADNTTFTGNYFINQTGTDASVFGGSLGILSIDANAQAAINGTLTLTGTTQQGFNANITSTAAATSRVRAYRSNITTAASTTVSSVEGYTTSGLTVGASGAVTNYTDFVGGTARTHAATNNATLADNTTFTGNYFINQTGTDASVFGGSISAANLSGTNTGDGAPMTTAGDLIYENATPAPARLPIGTSGQVLTVSGGLPSWQTVSGTGTVTSVAMTVPSFLSIAGSPVTTSGTLALTLSGTALPIANGGTGQTSASGAINALLPSQTGASGQFLTTNGTAASWSAVTGGITQLTGDVTAGPGSGSQASTVAKIAGVAVGTPTGTTNVVFSNSPTLVTPALGTPTALVGTNITGTAAGLTAGTVTTNANLTGPITSTGNATAIASQTGTGTTFVMSVSPTLTTPNLGTPSAAVLTNATGLPLTSGVTGILPAANLPTDVAYVDVANAFTATNTFTKTALGTTITDGIVLTNTTAAATGAQQISPSLRLTGQGWKTAVTAASQTVDWDIYVSPVQGSASPSSRLVLTYQINGGGFVASSGIIVQSNPTTTIPVLGLNGLNSPLTGLSTGAANQFGFCINGVDMASVGSNSFAINGTKMFGFTSAAPGSVPAPDTILTRFAAATWHLGAADAAAPVAQTLGVQGVVTGTSNTAGAAFSIAGSQGTGTGVGGVIQFQTAPASTTGSTPNALATVVTFDSAGQVGIGTTPAALLHTSTASGNVPIFFDAYGGSNNILGRRAAGTRASPTALGASGTMLQLGSTSYHTDGTPGFNTGPTAAIQMVANEAQTSTAQGTRIQFLTTKNTTASVVQRLTIQDSGQITAIQTAGDAEAATIDLQVKDTTPANPQDSAEVKIYLKSNKLVMQFNNGGTIRYATYDLTQAATAVWATSTTAP